jgi:aminopeptidase N
MPLEHRLHDRCACGSSLSSARYALGAPRPFVLSGTARVYERSRPFTIRHIALDLELDLDAKAIVGSATLEITRIDQRAKEITLDAVGFEIREVLLRAEGKEARPADHTYDGEKLSVRVPEGAAEASIRVAYRAVPRRGLYFLAPDEHVLDRPRQVWSQCQDEDARYIFPCHDKPHIKQTTELRVKVPEGWFALSNGELVNPEKEQSSGLFHWKMTEPHPSYLFTLAAGDLARIDDEPVNGVPVTYFVPKKREEDGRRTFKRTPEMIRRFGELLGVPYPWNKYAQVVVSDFIFGGMENTTATTMYEHILLDERAAIDITSDDLIAHELAHQWFGDLVTCRDWSHGWLNEGFATFMEHVDREQHLGREEYEHGLRGDMEMYLLEAKGRYRRPIVCQDYDAPIDLFDRHLYEKGACVLHLLRTELGDAIFWRGVRTYLVRHAKSVVETRDLMRALEEVSGKSLDRFFEQWVFRAGHAELEVKIEVEDDVTTIAVKQQQAPSPAHGHGREVPAGGATDAAPSVFALDLAFDFAIDGELRREVRRVDQASHTFVFHLPRRPRFVVVDPELAVLGDVSVTAPGDMLRAQLAEAKTARGRMLAAGPLGKLDDPPTTRALAEALAKEEEFWGVRAEAAEALGKLRSSEAFEALSASARTKHPKVRRAVARALGKWKTAKAADLLKKTALRDESYLVEAEAARALGATKHASALDTLVEVLDRPSWADVIRVGAIDGLANLRDDRATPHVLARTRYGVSPRGRRAAILALPKLSSDRRTRETLEDMLDADDPYLRVDVVRALGDLGDVKARGALQRQLERDLDGRVRRRIREVLRDLGGAGKREVDRLRDELEDMRREHAELRARLGKLEAGGASKAAAAAKAKASAAEGSHEREKPSDPAPRSEGRRASRKGKKR